MRILKGRFGGGSGGGDVTFKVESEFLKGKGLIGGVSDGILLLCGVGENTETSIRSSCQLYRNNSV